MWEGCVYPVPSMEGGEATPGRWGFQIPPQLVRFLVALSMHFAQEALSLWALAIPLPWIPRVENSSYAVWPFTLVSSPRHRASCCPGARLPPASASLPTPRALGLPLLLDFLPVPHHWLMHVCPCTDM